MLLIRNPIVWLMRVRHRRGYGVHSPFAFDFVTDVLYNADMYYAYANIDRTLHWWQKARIKSMRRLMFRLANYRRPHTLYCQGVDTDTLQAMQMGCKGMTTLQTGRHETADMIVLGESCDEALGYLGEGSMMVLWNLQQQQELWQRLKEDERLTVTFDLYDVGVAFSRKELNKQHYIINW